MARSKIDWEEVNATVEELPKLPPPNTHEIMRERGLANKQILLYRCEYVYNPLTDRKEKMAKVSCSACGATVYMEHIPATGCCHNGYTATGFYHYGLQTPIHHGDCTICHECGCAAEAVHVNYVGRGGYEIEEHFMTSAHRVRGHLAVLRWRISRIMMPEGTVHWRDYRCDGVLVVGGHTVEVRGYFKSFHTYSWGHMWEVRKQFHEPLGRIDEEHILPIEDVEIGTDSENSGFSAYMASGLKEYWPGAYLRTWVRHPNVENLARQDLRRYLNGVIKRAQTFGYSYQSHDFSVSITDTYINWKKVKPHEMIGIDKQDLWVAKAHSIEVVLHFAGEMMKGIRLTPDQLAAVEEIGVRRVITAVEDEYHGCSFSEVKLLNYLIRQQRRHPGCVSGWGLTLMTDYWRSCAELNGGRVPRSLQWPKDLKAAHDDMTARIRYKEDAELRTLFEERAEAMREYDYESEALGMSIRICATQAEMITEGKVLNHCVGRYAKDHALGRTTIFLIRRVKEPEKPFYTLEWKYHSIYQNHTNNNDKQTEEVLAFEREWLAHVARIEAKKEKEQKNEFKEKLAGIAV